MDLTIGGFALIPIMVGLLQVIKIAGVSERFIPLLGVLLGVVGMILLVDLSAIPVLAGIVIGLSSNGLYDFPSSFKK